MLRQLAAYYSKSPTHLFLIRISQGLVHMGKVSFIINIFFKTILHHRVDHVIPQ